MAAATAPSRQPVGPNVFPLVIGTGLALCGLAIAFGSAIPSKRKKSSFRRGRQPTPRPESLRPARLLPPALLLFYVVVATAWLHHYGRADRVRDVDRARARWKLSLPLAVLAPIGIHLIFSKLLRVPLPAGCCRCRGD